MTFVRKQGSRALRQTLIAMPVMAMALAGCGTAANNDTFDLSAMVRADGPSARRTQILVPQPTALKALESDQVIVRLSASEIQYLAKSQWGDVLPRLVQSKLVEVFENSGRIGGVGKPGQGLAIDYQVLTDIRAFEVDTGANVANVEIFAKLLNDRNGTVKIQQLFSAKVPVSGAENRDFVQALDRAFAKVAGDIVDWTLRSL